MEYRCFSERIYDAYIFRKMMLFRKKWHGMIIVIIISRLRDVLRTLSVRTAIEKIKEDDWL